MKLISYAQNFEDVILHRALKDVKCGFYIDVGAHDPLVDSVTKVFYEMGWRGINIEPVAFWFNKLVADRAEDINLRLATSDKIGKLEFFELIDTGLSTIEKDLANKHSKDFGYQIHQYEVPTVTLTSIINEHVNGEIHFLKIDVEGAEEITLQGLDLSQIRPWIILIESTAPMTQEPTYHAWEALIERNRYHFVYFDGLNRFYIADEHSELNDRFSSPPNVFDNFISHKEVFLQQETNHLNEALQAQKQEIHLLEERLQCILSSRSWKVTAPLRLVKNFFH